MYNLPPSSKLHGGQPRRFEFETNLSNNTSAYKIHKKQWIKRVRKHTNDVINARINAITSARAIRKMLLYVLKDTDFIFNLGDNDRCAGVLYISCGTFMRESIKCDIHIDYPRYHKLFISTIKKYRRLYRQYILFKYKTATQYMLSTCLPWDTIGTILSFM